MTAWPREIVALIGDSVFEKPKEIPFFVENEVLRTDVAPEQLSNLIQQDLMNMNRTLTRADLLTRPSLNFRAGRVKDSIGFWDYLSQFHQTENFEETHKIASGKFDWVRLKIS